VVECRLSRRRDDNRKRSYADKHEESFTASEADEDERRERVVLPYSPLRGRELPLAVVQRLLLSLHVSSRSSAELLEELGYLAVNCAHVLQLPGELRKYGSAGTV
jgi:hypothetical protein